MFTITKDNVEFIADGYNTYENAKAKRVVKSMYFRQQIGKSAMSEKMIKLLKNILW